MLKIKGLNTCLSVILAALSVAACSRSLDIPQMPENHKNGGKTVVGLKLSGEQTKTVMDPASATFRWEEGDRIALWAKDGSGNLTLAGQEFSLLATGHDGLGYFTSELNAPMAEGSYTYYISYPVPESASGTTAVFSVPAIQDGKAGNGIDITIGGPSVHGALSAYDESQPFSWNGSEDDGISMRMRHMLHFLRFYIPEGQNLLGEPVTKIEIGMPQAIAGSLSIDMADGSWTLENGTGEVTMVLDGGLGESRGGDYRYAVAGIVPPAQAYAAGETMEVTLYSDSKVGHVDPIRLDGRSFGAGHITSVPLRPTSVNDFYSITFTLADNFLGEDVQNVTLTLPEGVAWPGTGSNVYTLDGGIAKGASFRISTMSADEFRAVGGKDVSVRYESENAIVGESFTIGDLSSVSRYEKALTCPYLMFEDFSRVESFNSGDKHSASNVGDKDPYLFLDGWSIARAGGEAGKAVRLAAHREWFATYDSRCDSPMLRNLKDGRTVDVILIFNWSMGREEGGLGGNPKLGATLHVGSTSSASGLSSASTTGTFVESFNINEDTGSYDSIGNEHVTEISGMTNARRISWREVPDGTSGTSNGTYWIYLDNVRVQIKH